MWYIMPSWVVVDTCKYHTDAKYCSLHKLVKSEVAEIMHSEENLGKIIDSLQSPSC
jgi:hypothetical protein